MRRWMDGDGDDLWLRAATTTAAVEVFALAGRAHIFIHSTLDVHVCIHICRKGPEIESERESALIVSSLGSCALCIHSCPS